MCRAYYWLCCVRCTVYTVQCLVCTLYNWPNVGLAAASLPSAWPATRCTWCRLWRTRMQSAPGAGRRDTGHADVPTLKLVILIFLTLLVQDGKGRAYTSFVYAAPCCSAPSGTVRVRSAALLCPMLCRTLHCSAGDWVVLKALLIVISESSGARTHNSNVALS